MVSKTVNQQTIIRAPHDRKNPYFMMTRQAAQNEAMSYEARGLLAYLLSKPADWKIKVADIETEHCGRDKARNIIKELVRHGYMTAPERVQDKLGHWSWTPYQLYETPKTEKPKPDNQTTVEPNSVNTSSYILAEGQSTETESTSSAGAESTSPASPDTATKLSRAEWDALIVEIGNVFKAHGIEAVQYANMLTGKAKKGVFGQCAITPPVLAEELRAWWEAYHAANPKVALVKEPPKVFSAITEYRKSKPAASSNGNGKRKAYYQHAWVEASRLSADYTLDGTLRPGWMLAEIPAAGEYGGMVLREGEKVYHDGSLPLNWQGLE